MVSRSEIKDLLKSNTFLSRVRVSFEGESIKRKRGLKGKIPCCKCKHSQLVRRVRMLSTTQGLNWSLPYSWFIPFNLALHFSFRRVTFLTMKSWTRVLDKLWWGFCQPRRGWKRAAGEICCCMNDGSHSWGVPQLRTSAAVMVKIQTRKDMLDAFWGAHFERVRGQCGEITCCHSVHRSAEPSSVLCSGSGGFALSFGISGFLPNSITCTRVATYALS